MTDGARCPSRCNPDEWHRYGCTTLLIGMSRQSLLFRGGVWLESHPDDDSPLWRLAGQGPETSLIADRANSFLAELIDDLTHGRIYPTDISDLATRLLAKTSGPIKPNDEKDVAGRLMGAVEDALRRGGNTVVEVRIRDVLEVVAAIQSGRSVAVNGTVNP